MVLEGYSRSTSKNSGGVSVIRLAGVDDLALLDGSVPGELSFLSLRPGCRFVVYEFREDTASYTESVRSVGGSLFVEHELSFSLSPMDSPSRRAVTEIIERSPQGLIALVTTNCGATFLCGYSPFFGSERPLRVSSGLSSCGSSVSDRTDRRISLFSCDTSLSLLYTGPLPL